MKKHKSPAAQAFELKRYVTSRIKERFGVALNNYQYTKLNEIACETQPINVSFKDPNCDFRKIKAPEMGLSSYMVCIFDRELNKIKTVLYPEKEKELNEESVKRLIDKQNNIIKERSSKKSVDDLEKDVQYEVTITKKLNEGYLTVFTDYDGSAVIHSSMIKENINLKIGDTIPVNVIAKKVNKKTGKIRIFLKPI